MGSPETCPVCEDFAAACRHPAHYATPPAPADDARPMVTGGGLIKFDRRAADASGAEAMAPGCHEHVALWDAINAYSVACGGHPTRGGGARMDAVARVEKALRVALRREKESRSDDSRPASGQGGA